MLDSLTVEVSRHAVARYRERVWKWATDATVAAAVRRSVPADDQAWTRFYRGQILGFGKFHVRDGVLRLVLEWCDRRRVRVVTCYVPEEAAA